MAEGEERPPEISVVVATRNRRHLLGRLVSALAAQRGAPTFELIAVDDASDDGTAAELDRLAGIAPFPLRHVTLVRRGGPAVARNAGWQLARATRVAFTDDDCVPQPGWLAAIDDALQRADIARGATTANPTQHADGWFAWAPETSADRGFYETCNIGYRRAALAMVNGFDEAWRIDDCAGPLAARSEAPVWGEDTDLALRVQRAGGTTVFVPDAVVWHDLKPGRFRDMLADMPRRGGVVLAVKRHPELRDELESRWFTQQTHAWYLGALVGAALVLGDIRSPARWAAGAALAWPWARRRAVFYPRRAWPRVLPQWFVVDGAELVVMAAASARYRTLLL